MSGAQRVQKQQVTAIKNSAAGAQAVMTARKDSVRSTAAKQGMLDAGALRGAGLGRPRTATAALLLAAVLQARTPSLAVTKAGWGDAVGCEGVEGGAGAREGSRAARIWTWALSSAVGM